MKCLFAIQIKNNGRAIDSAVTDMKNEKLFSHFGDHVEFEIHLEIAV